MDNFEKYQGEDLIFPPYRYEGLQINNELFDLRVPSEVQEALQTIKDYRQQLEKGELDIYENKSTEPFSGGRSKIRYDELRLQIANDLHQGKHSLGWIEQHKEAKKIQELEKLKWNK